VARHQCSPAHGCAGWPRETAAEAEAIASDTGWHPGMTADLNRTTSATRP
jgi:hypothetical protein